MSSHVYSTNVFYFLTGCSVHLAKYVSQIPLEELYPLSWALCLVARPMRCLTVGYWDWDWAVYGHEKAVFLSEGDCV